MEYTRGYSFARKMEDGKPVLDDEGNEVLQYPDAQIPEYQTIKAAGADFFAAEDVTIPSFWRGIRFWEGLLDRVMSLGEQPTDEEKKMFQPTYVHTGVKAYMQEDEALYIYNRSSNPKKMGLVLANSVGLIDADYVDNPENDGEIMGSFYNFFPWDVKIKKGDRIMQGVFAKYLRPLEGQGLRVKGKERSGGWGSTGK